MSFFHLPAEVRQRVYSYTFEYGVAAAVSHDNEENVVVVFRPNERSAQLLRVSKVVHREASTIFMDQTDVTIPRDARTHYLSNANTVIIGPKSVSVRHLKIDFHPNNVADIDLHGLVYVDIPNIKDITLICFALCWSSNYPTGVEPDTLVSYNEAVLLLREDGRCASRQHKSERDGREKHNREGSRDRAIHGQS